MYKTGLVIAISFLLLTACQNQHTDKLQASIQPSQWVLPQVAVIKEAFTTLRDESDNVDSPALWHGHDGQHFFYEPEGIVLWECEVDSSGYYLMVDQGKINNTFQVFDRKTLEYIGGFSGEITRNTDGVAITQKAFGNFKEGAFYPVHNDGSLTAIAWEDIAKTLGLRNNCN